MVVTTVAAATAAGSSLRITDAGITTAIEMTVGGASVATIDVTVTVTGTVIGTVIAATAGKFRLRRFIAA